MRITVAKTAGFCFGVDRAVKLTYSLLDGGKKVCTLGPIIHNPQVISDLESRGVKIISEPSQTVPGSTVVIRAHGVAKSVEEELRKTGSEICDATCPFVAKIHRIVSENSSPEIPVLIAGDPDHPEVMGIVGHCRGKAVVFSDEEQLKKILENDKKLCESRIIVVSQTTFSEKAWILCKKIIKMVCTNPIIFDTICLATQNRQREAQELSEKSDIMIIIGGRQSSNTAKLKAVCSENCPTYLVERASELESIDFSGAETLGITAGASTPATIIKEVLFKMCEEVNATNELEAAAEEVRVAVSEVEEVPSDNEFDKLMEASLSTMSTDQHVKGIVMRVTPTEIQVDIGRKHAGYIPYDEYSSDPNADPAKELKFGDELDLIIMKTNDAEGTVMLSKRRYDAQKAWVEIADAAEDGRVFDGTVASVIKGGVIAVSNGARVFIPASQTGVRFKDPLDGLVGQKVKFIIIDVDKSRKRAVGSIRKAKEQAEKAFFETAEEGQTYKGIVKSLTSFGAFVELEGCVQGLVHVSELSWARIKDPSEVVSVGDEIDVTIKSITKAEGEKTKISLRYKKDEDDPWILFKNKYAVGDVAEVTIDGFSTFGAHVFFDIPTIKGLIHISQISDHRVNSAADVLNAGETVKAKITAIDDQTRHINLSIRALLEEAKAADPDAGAAYVEEAVDVETAAEAADDAE